MKGVERTGAGNQLDDFGLELQRDLKLAISEYAPGSEVVAAGYVWRSAGVKVYPDRRLPETPYYMLARAERSSWWLRANSRKSVPIAASRTRGRGLVVSSSQSSDS